MVTNMLELVEQLKGAFIIPLMSSFTTQIYKFNLCMVIKN